MGRLKSRSILSRQIAAILGTGEPFCPTGQNPTVYRGATRSLLLGGMALVTLNPSQVSAIGLGELDLVSRLGQPLRATVQMNVAQGENLLANCVTAKPRHAGLRVPDTVRVTSPAANAPGSYTVRISTNSPLHEPMYELSLVIECPDVPLFVHHYVLLIELPDLTTRAVTDIEPGNATQPMHAQAANSGSTPALEPATPDPEPDQTPARKPALVSSRVLTGSREEIPAGTRYRVRKGDTLSGIAERIAGRPPDTIWRVAMRIFMTNEHAFISDNSDLIKLGSVIQIPQVEELASFAQPDSTPEKPATSATIAFAAPAPRETTIPAKLETPRLETPDNVTPPVTARPPTTPETVLPTAPAGPVTNVADPVAATPPAENTFDPGETGPESGAGSESITIQPAAPTEVTPNAGKSEVSPWLAIGAGILLGFSLSLLMLRQRLLVALAAPFRRNRQKTRVPSWRKTRAERVPSANQPQADALLSEANEFLDTIAEDAFQTNAQYADYTGIIPVGKPAEDTYIVEVQRAPAEPTLQEADKVPAAQLAADTEVIEDNLEGSDSVHAATIADQPRENDSMSDDTMLAHLFDDAYVKAGDVIDPTSDVSGEVSNEARDPASEVFDPTADVPGQSWPEPIDPTADMPIHRPIESIDPTVDVPGQVDAVDPTADMPIRVMDTSLLPTIEMPKKPADDTPDHSSQIPMGAFGIDQATLSDALSEELGKISPETMFQTSDNFDESDDSPTDRNVAQLLAEVEEETVQTEVNEDDTFSNTLGDALSLLDREYEDEFTASQVLEGTAIRESLDERDTENPDFDPDEDEATQGKSRVG